MYNEREETKKKLLLLASFLDQLPPERFDYMRWADWGGETYRGQPTVGTCGTQACALGWAAVVPGIARDNVYLHPGTNTIKVFDRHLDALINDPDMAAQELFPGLSEDEIQFLFYPQDELGTAEFYEEDTPEEGEDGYANTEEDFTGQDMAKKIRKFVEYRFP